MNPAQHGHNNPKGSGVIICPFLRRLTAIAKRAASGGHTRPPSCPATSSPSNSGERGSGASQLISGRWKGDIPPYFESFVHLLRLFRPPRVAQRGFHTEKGEKYIFRFSRPVTVLSFASRADVNRRGLPPRPPLYFRLTTNNNKSASRRQLTAPRPNCRRRPRQTPFIAS